MASTIIFYLGFTVLTYALGNPLNLKDMRIVGGEETKIEELPYQLELQRSFQGGRWGFSCGAVIIDKEWVLSAGHCAEGFEANEIRFLSGETVRGSGAVHTVDSLVIHPNYTNYVGWADNDVSVFKVTPPFEFSNTTQAIEIIQEQPATGADAIVSGWGVTSSGATTLILNKVTIPIANHTLCAQLYGEMGVVITDAMLCAGDLEGGKGSCSGDSGGPITVDGKLVGLTSFGPGCADPGLPMVFANANNLASWIHEQISG